MEGIEHNVAERAAQDANNEFVEGVVDTIDGRSVSYEGTGCFWPEDLEMPQIGDVVRIYTIGGMFGRINGYAINGRLIEYRDQAAMEIQRQAQIAELDAEREAKWIIAEPNLDADYEALPPVLQRRIASLREAGGLEWRKHDEGYEMFICTQAVVIAKLGSDEKIKAWASINSDTPPEGYKPYDYQRQLAEAPEGFRDEHSGNTFGMACSLARALCRQDEPEMAEWIVGLPQGLTPIGGDPRYPKDEA